jgi:hypothetical protein
MKGEYEARLKVPPYNQTDNTFRRVIRQTIGAAATGGTIANIPDGGCFFSWLADVDCYIHWGTSSVQISADPATSIFFPAGVVWDFWHVPLDNYFNKIQKTTGGNLYYWRSSP